MNYQPVFCGYDLFYLHFIIMVDGVLGVHAQRALRYRGRNISSLSLIDVFMTAFIIVINLPHKLGSMIGLSKLWQSSSKFTAEKIRPILQVFHGWTQIQMDFPSIDYFEG
jgi:hypothetical protein